MKTTLLSFILGYFGSLAMVSAQASTVLLNDSFANGNRTTTDLPDSTAWYGSATSGLDVVGNELVMTDNRMAIGYFNPVTLAQGDTLTLTFTFSFSSAVNDQSAGFRVGLDFSNGKRVSADNTQLSNPLFADYAGYQMQTNPGSNGVGQTSIRKRNISSGTNTNLPGGSEWTYYSGTSSPGTNLEEGISYTGTVTVFRNESDETVVTYTLNDITTTITDSSGVFSYDTINFYMSNLNSSIAFSNVMVTTTAVVPEASSASLGLIGGGLLLLGCWSRRQLLARR